MNRSQKPIEQNHANHKSIHTVTQFIKLLKQEKLNDISFRDIY